MAEDVATLSVVVTNDGVPQATAGLRDLTKATAEAERELQALKVTAVETASSVPAIGKSAAPSLAAFASGTNAAGERSRYFAFAMETAQMQALKMDAALTATRASAAGAAGGIRTLSGDALGAGVATEGLVGSLAGMAIGSVVISGVVAGIGALVNLYHDYTKEADEAKDAAVAFHQTNEALGARAAALADVRAQLPGATLPDVGATKQIEETRKAVAGLREEMRQSSGVIDTFMENVSPRLAQVNGRLLELRKGVADGSITSDQFAHALHEVERNFPDYAPQILKAAQLTGEYVAATEALRRFNAEQANARAESAALAAGFGDDSLALARKQLAEAQSRVGALTSGGTTGLEARDAQLETVERATALWKEYAVTKGTAAESALSFSAALAEGNPHAVEAYRITTQTIAADKAVTDGKQARAEAERQAKQAAREAAQEAKRNAAELQKETDDYFNAQNKQKLGAREALALATRETDEMRRRVDAARDGAAASRELADQLELERATREFLARTNLVDTAARERAVATLQAEIRARQQLGHTLSDEKERRDKATDAAKHAAEEIAREGERRVRDFSRSASRIIAETLDALGTGKNPFQAWWDAGKQATNRFIAEIGGAKIGEKFGELLGFGQSAAANKQTAAAAVMLQAAQLQVAAANGMAGAGALGSLGASAGGWEHGGIADASTVMNPGSSRGATALGYGAIGAGGALTGYNVAGSLYSTSHGAPGNYARGALGGAASGALAGAAIGSVIPGIGTAIGAAVGGIAGFIGGLFGIGSAAKEAKRHLAELQTSLSLDMAALRAEVAKDPLAGQIAQVEAQREQRRRAIEEAYQGGGAGSEQVRKRNAALAEMNALEDTRIAQLREEAALIAADTARAQDRSIEDYQARTLLARADTLRAQGDTAGADALAKQADALVFEEKERREREDLIRSFGDEIDAREQAVLAALDEAQAADKQKFAAEAAAGALSDFATGVRNAPRGFRVEDYLRQVTDPVKLGAVQVTQRPAENPFVRPTTPLDATPSTPMTPTALSADLLRELSRDPMQDMVRALDERQRYEPATAPAPAGPTTITISITVNESDTPRTTAQAVAEQVAQQLRIRLTPAHVAQLNIQGLERRGAVRKGINTSLSATLNRG